MANVSGVVLIVTILVFGAYKYLIYPAFMTPLSRIPNAHFSASVSSIWMKWIRYKSTENRVVHLMHERLGPVVRLGPNEISVNCVDNGVRTVYNGAFPKHEFYSTFSTYGVSNMFSTLPSQPHSVRKRMISNIYSKSYLQSSSDISAISKIVVFDRLLPCTHQAANDRATVDVLSLFWATTLDFITAYIFGTSLATNFVRDPVAREKWLDLYHSRKSSSFWHQEFPSLTAWLKRVGIDLVPRHVSVANLELEKWCLEKCSAAEKDIAEEKSTFENQQHSLGCNTNPAVFKQLWDAMEEGLGISGELVTDYSWQQQKLNIASELLDHLTAGHETTGISLTYAAWELSHNPQLQKRLRAELRSLPVFSTTSQSLAPSKDIDALPLLNAVVCETLRRYPPIPGAQHRVTPDKPVSLGQHSSIPAKVRVHAQAYSLHRNEDVFPHSEEWQPERWLSASPSDKKEMARWFWAFGSGGRMCIGSNFAIQQMKLILATIYSGYETIIVDDKNMQQKDGYTTGPVGGKLLLEFKQVY